MLAFSLDPTELLAQAAAARLPGSLQTNRHARCAGCASTPTAPRPCSPARSSSARASSRRSAQIAAEELDLPLARLTIISGDTGRTPNEGQTAGSQSVENSGTALRHGGRGSARDADRSRGQEARRRGRHAEGRERRHQRRRQPQGHLRRAGRRGRPQARSDRQGRSRRTRRRTIVGQSIAAHRYSRRKCSAAPPSCRTCGRPAWCTAASCVRRATARRSKASTRRAVKSMPGVIAVVRDGSFLGVDRAARGAGDQGARGAGQGAKWKLGPELPDPAQHLRRI